MKIKFLTLLNCTTTP